MGTAKLTIFDIDPARASAVMDRLAPVHPDCVFEAGKDLGAVLTTASGIVQATPIGMASHPGTPFDPDLLSARLWVAKTTLAFFLRSVFSHSRSCAAKAGLSSTSQPSSMMIIVGEPSSRPSIRWNR